MVNIKDIYKFVDIKGLCLIELSSIIKGIENGHRTSRAQYQCSIRQHQRVLCGFKSKEIPLWTEKGKHSYLLDKQDFKLAIEILSSVDSSFGKQYEKFQERKKITN